MFLLELGDINMRTLKIEKKQNTIMCAGIIPVSFISRKVLMIQHPEGHWGFPKGHIEFEETEITAAKRELYEETGISLNFVLDTKKYRYTIVYLCKENERIVKKSVTFFLGITCNTDVVLAPNFRDYKWIDLEDLDTMDLFEQYRQLLIRISPLIRREIYLTSSDEINVENLERYQGIGSKHAYSRVAPLKILHENIKITNQPNILDTYFMNEMMKYDKVDSGENFVINQEDMSKCWSIMNMLPLLVYKHKKVLMKGVPTGCKIGTRPIELYVMIMEALGIEVKNIDSSYYFEYVGISEDIFIDLPFPSFSGTSVACYLALLNAHETCITNVSIEPEIVFLVNTLEQMGYQIWFEKEKRIIRIIGNPELQVEDISIKIPEDRNILVTRMISRLISRQKMQFVANYGLDFEIFFDFLKKIGINCYISNNYIVINDYDNCCNGAIDVESGFYPKICSDWQPIIAVLLLTYCKKFNIYDEVFENRYEYMKQLESFLSGFEYDYDEKHLQVNIENKIDVKEDGCRAFECLDIRAAATLYIALNNWKVTNFTVRNLEQFFRGYSSISDFSREFETRCKYVFDDE